MSERHGRRAPWLRSVRAQQPAHETPATILPASPRVGSLDALLREVDGLRLALETDLSLAASAVEAGATGVAVDILEGDRDGLSAFEGRALGHLSDLATEPVAPRRRRRRLGLTAVPFATAAAVVGFLVGVLPQTAPADDLTTTTVAASSSLEMLQDYAESGSTSQVRAAAVALHLQLMAVVEHAATNPAAAQQALLLLSYERDAIVQSGSGDALADVLLQSAALANRIRNAMPATVRVTVPQVPVVTMTSTSTSPSPKPSPTKARATSSPKPRPTSSPTPSSSSSDEPGVLPDADLAGG